MKTLLALILSAFVLVACGGGDPEPVPSCTAEAPLNGKHKTPPPPAPTPDPCADSSERQAPLVIRSPDGIPNPTVVYEFQNFSQPSGPQYYAEGDLVAVRFDNANSSDWVEYKLISSSVNGVILDMRAPSVEIPGVYDVATLTFFMTATGALKGQVTAFTTSGQATWNVNPYTLAGSVGMKSPTIGWFSGGTKIRDLIEYPL
jgi:hypothetical protein